MNISGMLNHDEHSVKSTDSAVEADRSAIELESMTFHPRRSSRSIVVDQKSHPEHNTSGPIPSAAGASSQNKKKELKTPAKSEHGRPIGTVNFPPFDVPNGFFRRELEKFEAYPISRKFPVHIPYSSDKKGFKAQTGRDCFDGTATIPPTKDIANDAKVFQYIVKDGDRSGTVMWDYINGLVRITAFFKVCGLGKTMPNKAIAMTPGLAEMCHSITGGALAAQGYWMPFEAAKALAATFCWKIRYALTPIFGPGFVDICIPPSEPSHGQFSIPSQVVEHCQKEVEGWTKRKKNVTESLAIRHREDDTDKLTLRAAEDANQNSTKDLRRRATQPQHADGSSDEATDLNLTPGNSSSWRAVNAGAYTTRGLIPSTPPRTHSSTPMSKAGSYDSAFSRQTQSDLDEATFPPSLVTPPTPRPQKRRRVQFEHTAHHVDPAQEPRFISPEDHEAAQTLVLMGLGRH